MMEENECPRRVPPDLQDLVKRYGAYSQIPPHAWADFDRQMEGYRNSVRKDLDWPPSQDGKWPPHPAH